MEIKKPVAKSREQALEALMTRCARAEVCTADARRLMYRWGVPPEDFDWVLERLWRDKFIDDERYAAAYVRDKINFSRWGARKISEGLHLKRLPREVIAAAMSQIETEPMERKLEADLAKKRASIKEENIYKVKDKLIRFGISRGFDYESVCDAVERLLKKSNE